MSGRDLAKAVTDEGVTIAHSAIVRIELGQRSVSVDDLLVLASALGVYPSALLRDAPPGVEEPRMVELDPETGLPLR